MRFAKFVAFALFSLGSSVVWADTISTYDINATLASGVSITGYFTMDTTNGEVTSWGYSSSDGTSITAAAYAPTAPYYNSSPGLITGGDPSATYSFPNVQELVLAADTISGGPDTEQGMYLFFSVPTDEFVANGGTIVPAFTYSGLNEQTLPGTSFLFDGTSEDNVTSGTVTLESPVSPVPETNSILLVGTGLAGMVGVVRRRLSTKGL